MGVFMSRRFSGESIRFIMHNVHEIFSLTLGYIVNLWHTMRCHMIGVGLSAVFQFETH